MDVNFKEDLLKAPNLITFIRILLLPVYVWVYFAKGNLAAFGIIAFIIATDLVDGFVARRFNLITKLGQLLDPLADKLIQITVVLCLFFNERLIPMWFMIILLVKEFTMMLGSAVLLKRSNQNIPAHWFGKLSTGMFYLAIVIVYFFERKYLKLATVLLVLAAISLIFSFIRYSIIFMRIIKKDNKI